LASLGARIQTIDADLLTVTGTTAEQIGEAARAAGIALHELAPQQVSLEDAFMRITRDAVEYRTEALLEPVSAAA
jgi:ABC-2 type transport system ATP-binding protein